MRKTVNTLRQFVLGTCLTAGLTVAAMAQTSAPISGQMRLKVTARNGNELREIERTYRSDGMTDEKRDAIVNKLIDSLRATRKGKDSQ
ncbi:MAG: T9SS C-terminal target domain-containing protein, partial [Cytophagaceae bacterium]